jgi:hypothetical protein
MSEYRMAPSQYMDGKAVIYLASGHLTGQPNKQPLQFAFAWDGNVPSLLCLVSCASVFALGKNPIEWLLRGNSIYFSSQNRDLTRPKTLPRSQLFEHITTVLKHAPLYQPTAHKLSITYTRSWSLYNASEHRIPQGRHVIAATCAAARKSKRLSGRLETIARQHTHIHTSDHGYQREPIRPGRRGRNGRH